MTESIISVALPMTQWEMLLEMFATIEDFQGLGGDKQRKTYLSEKPK